MHDTCFTHYITGAPSEFAITAVTSSPTVDGLLEFRVQALDQFGNVVDTFESDVSVDIVGRTSGTTFNTGNTLVDIVNGQGTVQVQVTVAETVDATMRDTESTGLGLNSADAAVASGVPVSIVILPLADAVVEEIVEVQLEAHDQFGNIAVTANEDVALAVTGSVTIIGSPTVTVAPTGSVNVVSVVAETVTLSISGSSLDVTSTETLTYLPGE